MPHYSTPDQRRETRFLRRIRFFSEAGESTQETIQNLVNNCREEMVPGDFVQTPEEVLSHPEYIKQDNQWMDKFLTQLRKKRY